MLKSLDSNEAQQINHCWDAKCFLFFSKVTHWAWYKKLSIARYWCYHSVIFLWSNLVCLNRFCKWNIDRLDFIFPSSRVNIQSSNRIHVAVCEKLSSYTKPQTSGSTSWKQSSQSPSVPVVYRQLLFPSQDNSCPAGPEQHGNQKRHLLSCLFNLRCCLLLACGDSAPPAQVFFRDTDCSLPQHIVWVLQKVRCF